jgi:hypothetical protein
MGVQRTTDYGLRISETEVRKVLQARMGHSSIAVTMHVYGGLFSGFDACLDPKAQHDDATLSHDRVALDLDVKGH